MVKLSCFVICIFLAVSVGGTAIATTQRAASQLEGFYVVTEAISDAAPFRFAYILDVRQDPTRSETMVRRIRIAALDEHCSEIVTVKAVEKRLKGVPLRQLAGSLDLCSVTGEQLNRAIEKAGSVKAALDDTARYGIVAACGGIERVLHLPYPEQLRFKRLERQSPQIARLWDLSYQVVVKAFGEGSQFHDISKERDLELQSFAPSVLTDLQAGKFDRGFWNYCDVNTEERESSKRCDPQPTRTLLKRYHGPILLPDRTPRLVKPHDSNFARYVTPVYPALAKQARIKGIVELDLLIDEGTGAVKEAKALTGHNLLRQSAITAAQSWKFAPTVQALGQPVRVVLDYSLDCPPLQNRRP